MKIKEKIIKDVLESNSFSIYEKKLIVKLFKNNFLNGQAELIINNLPYNSRNRFIEFLSNYGEDEPESILNIYKMLLIDDLLTEQIITESLGKWAFEKPDLLFEILSKIAIDPFPASRERIEERLVLFIPDFEDVIFSFVLKWSNTSNRFKRELSARLLKYFKLEKHKELFTILHKLLKDSYSEVRLYALKSFNELNIVCNSLIFNQIKLMIKDIRWSIRSEALKALRNVEFKNLVPSIKILINSLYDPVLRVAREAALTLKHLYSKYPNILLKHLLTIKPDLSFIYPEVNQLLINIFNNEYDYMEFELNREFKGENYNLRKRKLWFYFN